MPFKLYNVIFWHPHTHTHTPSRKGTHSSLPNMSLCPLVIPPSFAPLLPSVHRQPLICFLSLHSFAFSWMLCTIMLYVLFSSGFTHSSSTLLCALTAHFFPLLGSIPLFGFTSTPTWMGRLKFRKVKWLAQGHLAGNWWTWIQVVASRASALNCYLCVLSYWTMMLFPLVGRIMPSATPQKTCLHPICRSCEDGM